MALSPGSRLGPYEVTAQIGEGGMGEVYQAIDTNLKRAVAIKVLPTSAAADVERMARFQREAEVLAALNHPNIAAIYGLERSGPTTALVMELVEGPTLADRIAHGALPLDDALSIATQIADALEAAHEQRIIHRDLKPANVKVRPDGTVKVLDFGLAKALEPTGATAVSQSMSPTITTPAMTQAGMILGTAAYMSPEQAKGREADRRSDVWAFGCVLFEMLSGTRPFAGEDIPDTFVAVLRDEPPWSVLPPETPSAIRRLLRRCLEKDRTRRLSEVHTARLEIDDARNEPRDAIRAGAIPSRRYERLAWVSALALVSVAAVAGLWRSNVAPVATPLPEMRVDIAAPPTTEPASLAISPDGQTLAFVATVDGQSRVWLRPLNTASPRVLADTDGARFPFWSPDSRSVAFFGDEQLKRIDIDGGSARTLASAPGAVGGAWGPNGVILMSMLGNPIVRVSDRGGDPAAVTRLDAGQGAHYFPQFLPDGRHFLYWAVGGPEPNSVFVGQLDRTETHRLLDADVAALYASKGYLLFVRQGALLAQRFDPNLLTLTAAPFPVAEQVAYSTERLSPAVSTSAAGALAYRAGSPLGARKQLTWFDRSGRALGNLGGSFDSTQLALSLSPDDRQVALFRAVSRNMDVWLIDVARGVPTRFTFDSADDVLPVWSRDGRRIVFSSNRKGVQDLYVKSATGAGDVDTLLLQSAQFKGASDWSPDGHYVLYQSVDPKHGNDILALPLDGNGKPQGEPQVVVQTDFDEHGGQFSPDGKWIAYVSIKSGRYEVYVQPFAQRSAGEIRVSTDGGDQVRWRPDGKELYYVARDGRLMAVPIRWGSNGETVEPGAPVPLFATRVRGMPVGQTQYAVSSDGQRFLMNTLIEEVVTSPITMILNWRPNR
jgi:Tol biopolymer transport system component